MSRVEGGVLPHVKPGLGVALAVEDGLDPVEAVGLEGQYPFVIAHAEGGQGRSLDIGEPRARAAVLGHDAGTLLRGQQIPFVGADEGVDGHPVAGGHAAQAGGNVLLVELGGSVLAHDRPHWSQPGAQRGGDERPVGPLEHQGVVCEPPDEQVGVGAEGGDVIPPSGDGARGVAGLAGRVGESPPLQGIRRQRLVGREHRGQAVVQSAVHGLRVDVGCVPRIGGGFVHCLVSFVCAPFSPQRRRRGDSMRPVRSSHRPSVRGRLRRGRPPPAPGMRPGGIPRATGRSP